MGLPAARQHTSLLKVLMRNIDLHLEPEQVRASKTIAESGSTPALRRRALILLSYADGNPTRQVAQEVGLSTGRVCYWRRQFRARGMDIFRTRNSPPGTQQSPGSPIRTEIPKGATILENIQTGIHNHEISSGGGARAGVDALTSDSGRRRKRGPAFTREARGHLRRNARRAQKSKNRLSPRWKKPGSRR
jgi:hypothetical protein